MAMNYQNFASLGVNLNRQKYGPLDISNVFTSEADLKYYLSKGTFVEGVSEYWYKNANEKIVPYPYEGQVLATVINGVVNVYALALNENGDFVTQEIAGKIEVDNKTIKLNDEGKLELVGLPTNTAGKTYVPSYVNGELVWAEPDTSTAEGQQQAIDGLTASVANLGEILNGKPAVGEEDSEDYVPAVEGLVAKVAANAQAVVDEASARDAADKVLEGKIAEALQEAKDYADENDANTVYNDAELRGRIEVIEGDYLKAEDKYDDTELAGRVTTTEGKISTLEGVVGNEESGLVKALADEVARAEKAESDLSDRINAIDFIDADELADAIKDLATTQYVNDEIDAIEEAIANLNHFKAEVVDSVEKVTENGVLYLIKDESVTGVDKYNEYIVVGGVATLIGDTTTDLSNYYDKNEIDDIVDTLGDTIADEVEAREALAEQVEALMEVDNATQEELDAYKLEVTEAIRVAKEAAITDADGKLANKVNTSDFESFKTSNTSAIATAKQEAIDAAKVAEEAKGYAVAETVAETYATKAALTEAVEGIENDLLSYAKINDVEVELAKKIETATVAHSSEEKAEGVTVNGTQLNIVVDAYTKQEVRDYVADVIEDMTGGESAADVLLALNNHIATYEEKVGQLDAKNGTQDTAIAAAQTQADKGVADAAKVAGDLVTTNSAVAANAREIEVVKGNITTINETLSGEISGLKSKDVELAGQISGLSTSVSEHATTIGEHTAAITALQNKDAELVSLINSVDGKFANYYDKDTVDAKVKAAIDAIPEVDFTGYATETYVDNAITVVNGEVAKKADADNVYTIAQADAKFMTDAQVKATIDKVVADVSDTDTIEGLVTLVNYVHDNAGDIAELVSNVENNGKAIAKNAEDIVAINTSIGEINEAIAAIVQPKASAEISVAANGELGINEVNVNKLVQTTGDTLILNGGTAE